MLSMIASSAGRFPWRKILALFCAGLVCCALWAEAAQTRVADHVIRLHVLANSDSKNDQALKFSVRDAVLKQTQILLSGRESVQEAADILSRNLRPLTQTAVQALLRQGCDDPVQVRLESAWFPTRYYQGVALPAGTYQALRVIIGTGAGHNWWCMVFPSLCLPAVTESSLETAGLSQKDCALLTEDDLSCTLKFKTVEWWSLCKHRLASWRAAKTPLTEAQLPSGASGAAGEIE